jgi:hypothetical protein
LRFSPGRVVATSAALALLGHHGKAPSEYLNRHLSGDWGDLDARDRQENERGVREGFRIFSAYSTPVGRIWIITEADRSSTCILLPGEY